MTVTNTSSDGYLHPPDPLNRGSHNSKSSLTLLSDTSDSRSSSDHDHIALTPARTPSRNSNVSNSSIEFPDRTSNDSNNDSDTTSLYSPDFSAFERRQKTPKQIIKELTIEVMPALLVSVAGSICAGYILGRIQNYPAFDQIPALFIMVPVMLNLKSNTELNMSTRMSTLANLGVFDNKTEGIKAIRSNLELLLLQSTVVGTSVGLISTILSLVPSSSSSSNGFMEFLLQASILMSSGIGCAVIGSSLIGILISFTVYVSHAHGVDPDNIGTPIASSFGDMTTLLILGLLTSMLMSVIRTPWPIMITLGFMSLGLLLLKIVRNNDQTRDHLSKGWLPLVYAAVTSSIAGIVVEKFAIKYPGMPSLVPVLNGIGGNIGTVFASRLSTSLHRRHQNADAEHNLVMFILLIINIPIQIGFLALHRFFDPSLTVNIWFVFIYISATVVHGLAILSLAKIACKVLWARGYDPDDCVNPFITGSGDMLGTILLALVFIIG
ncbi:hypothetical protein GGF40_003558 [Coemansia sp. RSA 1286]|nr:hypothetical protein GGF40_003558 [Coemansia sp. RSA 1286]